MYLAKNLSQKQVQRRFQKTIHTQRSETMNHEAYNSNTDNLTFPNNLPSELLSIKQDLESLSGDALNVYLKRWKAKLLTDTTEASLIFMVFSEIRRKVVSDTSPRDCLFFLDFLSELKQSLYSCDIFCYGEHIYKQYLEEIYSLSGCCSYYYKDTFMQKYAAEELEHYQQTRAILEEHYQKEMSRWLEIDFNDRLKFYPSKEEIQYLCNHAQNLFRTDGNIDQSLFYQYRAILLALKRYRNCDSSESLQENKTLLNCIHEMAFIFQISSDSTHALEMLEYAQTIADQELSKWSANEQTISLQNPDTWTDHLKETIPLDYFETLYVILRKTGHIKSELSNAESNISREDVMTSYQKALSFSEAVFGSDSSQAESLRGDIALFCASSKTEEKVNVLLTQLKEAEQAEDMDSMENLHGLISEAYEDGGNFEQAIVHWKKKVDILVEIYGDDSDVAADYYNMFGELYERAGKDAEARDCYNHALENYQSYLLRTQEEDADDAENILSNYEECLYQTGRMHLNVGEYEQAISQFQEALEIYNSRNNYSGIERAHYMRALAQAYEKISFMGRAVHYYLFAWDTYHTVAEFNKLRERGASLFVSETAECEECEEQVRRHLIALGYDHLFQPFEAIDYPSLTQEEQNYFLTRFAQIIRRRLQNVTLEEKWIIIWRIYWQLCTDWEQWINVKIPIAILDALHVLQGYFAQEVSEEEFADFSETYWKYVSANLSEENEFDIDEEDEFDIDEEDELDIDEEDEFDIGEEDGVYNTEDLENLTDEEEQVLRWNPLYLVFYSAIADFFQAISEADVDFNSLQTLICNHLPSYAEAFTTVYHKEEEYTSYEKELRYKQVVSSPAFASWIAAIQEIIKSH